jgi:hypothetical protein
MKSSATACFELPWAVGIITLVWKFFIAHDSKAGTVKETMGWNDVLAMEILVSSNCWRSIDLAIDLAIQFGNSIWQFDLAI